MYVMLSRGVFPQGEGAAVFWCLGFWLVVVTRCKNNILTIMSMREYRTRYEKSDAYSLAELPAGYAWEEQSPAERQALLWAYCPQIHEDEPAIPNLL